MSKKKIIIIGIVLLILVTPFIFYYHKTPVYSYVDEVKSENEVISFRVFGAGNGNYGGYEIYEKEDGIYVFQLYRKTVFGSYYPKTITINNNDHHIKKLMQKTIDGNGFEVIYE